MPDDGSKTLAKRPGGMPEDQRLILLWLTEEGGEQIFLTNGGHYILGRFGPNQGVRKMINLIDYDGAKSISRTHAQIHMENDRIYLTDLESANGTFLQGKRLEPHSPQELKDGDRFSLGRLMIEIEFRS